MQGEFIMAGESLIAKPEAISETGMAPDSSGAVNLSREAFPLRLSSAGLNNSSMMAAENVHNRDAADIQGLVVTAAGELGVAFALSSAGLLRSGRVPEPAMNAMALGVGFLAGGLVNNRVAGRPWLDSEGFKRNAIGAGIANVGFLSAWWATR
jgi:hypothetical protein